MRNLSETLEVRNNFIENYVSFFQERGYSYSKPAEFITPDTSLLFTNSTIVPWKNYACSEPIPKKGIFVNPKQPCLRLHCLTDTLFYQAVTERRSKRLLGYFNMLGVLCEEEKADSLPFDALNLLVDIYKIPKENIRIFVSGENDFIGSLEGKVQIIQEVEERNSFFWVYGNNSNLIGEGAKIQLLQEDGNFASIGQIIRINSPYKTTFEFGFGVETLLSTLESRVDYSPWTIYHCLPENYRFKTILDLTSCFGAISTLNPDLMNSKHRKEVIRLGRRIIRAEKIFNIPLGTLEDAINKFINLEFHQDLKAYIKDKLFNSRVLEENGKAD